MSDITFLPGRAWLSIPRFQFNLYRELEIEEVYISSNKQRDDLRFFGDIVYKENVEGEVFWKRIELEKPFVVRVESINEAASVLKSIQRNWALHPFRCVRRSNLIKQKLPFLSEKKRVFPYSIPISPMGIFTLLDEHTLLASAKTSSPLPLGQLYFEEDHINPPSRAYLKLYEALVLMDYYKRVYNEDAKCNAENSSSLEEENKDEGIFGETDKKPFANLTCVDAGACPGGWSWVLDALGANIIAVDRSPLAATLMNKPNIKFIKHDAFTLSPDFFGKIDWLFSDVVCYPPRLLQWLYKWVESGLCEHFVCTIKMQGEADMESIRQAARIPHSKIVHLTANKHEITFLNAPFL